MSGIGFPFDCDFDVVGGEPENFDVLGQYPGLDTTYRAVSPAVAIWSSPRDDYYLGNRTDNSFFSGYEFCHVHVCSGGGCPSPFSLRIAAALRIS